MQDKIENSLKKNPKTEQSENRVKSIICWIIAIVFAFAAIISSILPFIFMVLNSFKGKFEMLTKGVFALPEGFQLSKSIKRRIYKILYKQCYNFTCFTCADSFYFSLCFLSACKIQI